MKEFHFVKGTDANGNMVLIPMEKIDRFCTNNGKPFGVLEKNVVCATFVADGAEFALGWNYRAGLPNENPFAYNNGSLADGFAKLLEKMSCWQAKADEYRETLRKREVAE